MELIKTKMEAVRLIKPYVTFEEVEEDFRNVFSSGIFTRGPHVSAFAEELSNYVGAKHTFLTTSATTSLWMSLKLLDVGIGDEVVVSDFSFPATANVVEDLGAQPIFADVDSQTFNMRADDLRAKISSRTKAVIFVDAFGNPSGLHEIKAICAENDLPLIEDAACAIGSSEKGRRCGSIADITCFSFHPRKLLCTGEGGAITTDNDDWANWLSIKLMHGAGIVETGGMDFTDYGYNFRMSELQAVMGRKQLKKIDTIATERNASREILIKLLAPMGFLPQEHNKETRCNVQSLVFKLPLSINRDDLIIKLQKLGVESTIGTYCQSGTSYFKSKYGKVQTVSKMLQDTTITLPCYSGVPLEEIAKKIRSVLM